jgi:hypothetical protein
MPGQKRSNKPVGEKRSNARRVRAGKADEPIQESALPSGPDSPPTVKEAAGHTPTPSLSLAKVVFESANVFKPNKVIVGAAGVIGAAAFAYSVLPNHRDAVFYSALILSTAFVLAIIKGALTVKDRHIRWIALPILVFFGIAICCFIVVLVTSFGWGVPAMAAHRLFGDQPKATEGSAFNPYESIELRSVAMWPLQFDPSTQGPVARNIVRAAITDRVVLHNRLGKRLNDIAATIREGKLNEAIVSVTEFIDDSTAMEVKQKGDNNDEAVRKHMMRLEALASNLGEALRPLSTQVIPPSTSQFDNVESTYLKVRSEVEDLLTDNNLRPPSDLNGH